MLVVSYTMQPMEEFMKQAALKKIVMVDFETMFWLKGTQPADEKPDIIEAAWCKMDLEAKNMKTEGKLFKPQNCYLSKVFKDTTGLCEDDLKDAFDNPLDALPNLKDHLAVTWMPKQANEYCGIVDPFQRSRSARIMCLSNLVSLVFEGMNPGRIWDCCVSFGIKPIGTQFRAFYDVQNMAKIFIHANKLAQADKRKADVWNSHFRV
jgi:hypothetical protein